MRIGIDTQSIIEKKTGLGIYTQNLLYALKKIAPENEYVEIHSACCRDLSTPKRWWWDQVSFSMQAKKARLDLVHKPCFSAPIFYRGKIVLTVHDIIPVFFKGGLSFSSQLYYARWMPYTFKKANKIIAVSESTKRDLIRYLNIPAEQIRVIYEGGSFENMLVGTAEADRNRVRNKYDLPEKFLLCVSTLEPKKNLPFLVKCFCLAKKRFNFSEKLVIVGKTGWDTGRFFEQIKQYDLEKEVILPGYIPDNDLLVLFKMASVFIFPSLYEGFGLPVLDALQLGCPVIVSNTSSMPEIVGASGILINPKKEKEWVKAIGLMTTKKELRRRYIELGIKQGKKFSWQKCAKETLEVYYEVVNN